MVDIHTKQQRSYNMSCVKSRNTKLEVSFRKALFARGLKGYRVTAKLPGKPDIVFTRYKIAIFIDGCFWHKCAKCFSLPSSNRGFWESKINANVVRDKKNNRKLKNMGYCVIRFWEHDIKSNIDKCVDKVEKKIFEFVRASK